MAIYEICPDCGKYVKMTGFFGGLHLCRESRYYYVNDSNGEKHYLDDLSFTYNTKDMQSTSFAIGLVKDKRTGEVGTINRE